MKKLVLVAVVFVFLFAVVGTAMAAKPAGLGGAQTYAWHLSGAVMPVPPWGSLDKTGSDTASKLIVNQPNGNTEVTITGVMNGLYPNTEYTVCLSNEWLTSEKWDITGEWNLTFMYSGSPYNHDMTVTFQNMYTGVFSGYGHSNTDSSIWDIQATSNVSGDTIHLDLIYTGVNAGYTVHAVGTIDSNGHIVNGNWTSSAAQSGTWSSITGHATKETVGNGYPGQFPGLGRFTFTTDEYGAGSWHINLTDANFTEPGTYTLSVWININEPWKTILISDNFKVVVSN